MARKIEPRPAKKISARGSAKKRATPAKRVASPAKSPSPRKRTATAPRRKSPRATQTTRRATSVAEDALAVEAQNRRYYDAFQSLSVEEIAKLWWQDDAVTCIHPGADIRTGIGEVLTSYAEILTGTTSIRFALGDVRVRVIGDLAYVNCVENLVTVEQDAGDYLGAVLATNVFERRKSDWRLVHHHASPIAVEEGALVEGPLH
jgi:ketosteroid isomerase-like protein